MRVTDGMLFRQINRNVRIAKNRHADTYEMAQTGIRVARHSDDPVSASKSLVIQNSLSRLESQSRIAAGAERNLATTESVLAEAEVLMRRVTELAVQGASESLSQRDRQALALEVEQLKEQMLALANTDLGGVYIFGGNHNTSPPFREPYDADGDGVVDTSIAAEAGVHYVGDNGSRVVEVAPGLQVTMNIPGGEVFGYSNVDSNGDGVRDQSTVFSVLEELQTALNTDDTETISGKLTDLETFENKILGARVKVGTWLKTAMSASNIRTEIQTALEEERASTVEVDAAEAFSKFSQTQFSLEASIAQAQRIMQSISSSALF